jgi:hypothetical protein
VTWARFIEGELRKCNFKSDPKRFKALLSTSKRNAFDAGHKAATFTKNKYAPCQARD